MFHAAIPFIDLRGKTPMDLMRAYPDRARDLVRDSRKSWGLPSQMASVVALPFADRLSLRWLRAQHNPYLYEIESCAELLGKPGGIALNVCFEWGCTGGVWANGETVTLMHVLDWPFPGLGKYAVIALQQGRAGDFYHVTWPGMVGVFNGMAPGRFSAAINQAPMRKHNTGFAGDWLINRIRMRRERGLPPAHLLRYVCESAKDYTEAKNLLVKTPLAIPAIFTLAGTQPGEGCVIERLEEMAEVIEIGSGSQVSAANHFIGRFQAEGEGWWPREIDSAGRYRYCGRITAHDVSQPNFGWLKAPIINTNTRMAHISDPATSRFIAQGYEGIVPVTALFTLPERDAEERQAI